jgi:regulator of extracellular matrix RemA (YlzA/DUF370 family)
MSGNCNFELSNAKIGNIITGDVIGDITTIQIDSTPEKNLAEAAAEIQQLLEQLYRSNPTTSKPEKQVIATDIIEQTIKQNPTLKERLRSALKAGGVEALKAIFNHPLINIPIETIKGWIEAE